MLAWKLTKFLIMKRPKPFEKDMLNQKHVQKERALHLPFAIKIVTAVVLRAVVSLSELSAIGIVHGVGTGNMSQIVGVVDTNLNPINHLLCTLLSHVVLLGSHLAELLLQYAGVGVEDRPGLGLGLRLSCGDDLVHESVVVRAGHV